MIDTKFVIAHTWDGHSIAERDQVSLSLRWDAHFLCVDVVAPFYRDPAPSQAPRSTWGLWEYEVVEAFLVGEDGHYTELEWGPHGHFLGLRLDAPRSITHKEDPMEYTTKIEGDKWYGFAKISREFLPSTINRINFFAIHGVGESRQYLAYHPLPDSKPNFHQPHRFPLFLESSFYV